MLILLVYHICTTLETNQDPAVLITWGSGDNLIGREKMWDTPLETAQIALNTDYL